jgi:hypothetical protein
MPSKERLTSESLDHGVEDGPDPVEHDIVTAAGNELRAAMRNFLCAIAPD